MRKMIAGLMILLMIMSTFPHQIDEETKNLDIQHEPFFSNGPEVELVSLNTLYYNQTLYNGDIVPFDVLIANSGTTFIYDISVTVEIWSFNVAVGDNETLPFELTSSWTKVPVCNDDADGDGNPDCPFQVINPSSVVDDGTGSYSVPGVVWTPDVGSYRVRVYITVNDDTDLTNNLIEYPISVLDSYDLSTRLAWNSSILDDTLDMGATSGTHDFTVTVSASSTADPADYSIRNVRLMLEVTGGTALTDTHLNDGNETATGTSFYAGSPSHIIIDQIGDLNPETIVGYAETQDEGVVEVYLQRHVVNDRTDYSVSGSITTDGTEGSIHISVTVLSFVVYDSENPPMECFTGMSGMPGPCEANRTSDTNANNDNDIIHAYNGVIHDVQLNSLIVRTPEGEVSGGKIGVGNHTITVNASHTGSDSSQNYYVNASATMHDELGNLIGQYGPYGDCMAAPIVLGSPEEPGATQMSIDICFGLDFYPGTITLTVTLTLDDGGTDEYQINNVITTTFEVHNENPIAHMILEPPEDLLVGSTVLLYGFSVDSDNYMYDFSYTFYRVDADSTETEITCTNNRTSAGPNCAADIDSLWIETAALKIVVEDYYGGVGIALIPIDVWATTTISDLDETFEYAMVYKSSSAYSATVSQAPNIVNEQLPAIPGKHDSLAVWDYSSMSDVPMVNRHELVVTFPRSADGDGTLWFQSPGSSSWENVDDSAVSSTSQTTQTIRWTDIDGSEDPILSGKYAVFATDAGAPPDLAVSGLIVENSAGGSIELDWDIVGGDFEVEDRLVIYYSSGGDALDVENALTHTIDSDSTTFWRLTNAMHGQTYHFLLCVENDNGANIDGCKDDSIDADSMVSPIPVVTNLKIEAVGETQLRVSWEATAGDVDHWIVCMGMSQSSTSQCFETTGPISEKILSKPTQKVKWFFNIYAEDDVKNTENVGSTSIDLSDPNAFDAGVGGPVLGSAEEGQVPMWAFGLIGGVVVLSIIIGAVIISRGTDEDDDDQWDY